MSRCRPAAALLGGLLLFAAPPPLSGQSSSQADDPVFETGRHAFRVTTVAGGLEHPWSVAWLPNGDMLVTERPGRLRLVRDGELDPRPIDGVPQIRARGQGGLLEVLPHPDFEGNRLIYLSFSKPDADGSRATTAVVRGRLEGHRLVDVEEIFEAEAWAEGNAHFAGRMAFDPNAYLFVSVGDRGADPDLLEEHPAQDLTNHQGTVIRLHDDGRVPDDNPFVNRPDALPEIWSYGHRNPQGLAVHPQSGEVWVNEHGPRGGDEVNVVRAGRNYGWPVISYGIHYSGEVFTGRTHEEGMEQPLHFWVPSIATSGLLFYTGDRFPWWRGNVFVGGLRGEQLARLTFRGHDALSQETLLAGELGRIRDVRQGPDGLIYLALDDRRGQRPTRIVRLEPAQSDVRVPND